MTREMRRKPGSLTSRLLVSAALIVASGVYGYWQNRLQPEGQRRLHFAAAKVMPPAKPIASKSTLAEPPPAAVAPSIVAPASPAPVPSRVKVNPAPAPETTPQPQAAENQASADPATIASPATTEPEADTPPIAPHRIYAFSDGDYTGTPAECEWGTVQVKVSIHDGAITAVQFLQIPDHRARSAEISDWAAPMLASRRSRNRIMTSISFRPPPSPV